MTIFNTVISTVPKSACGDRVHLPSVQRLGEGVLGVREETLFVRRKRPRKSLPRPLFIRAPLVANFRVFPRSSYCQMPLLPDVPLLCSKNALIRPKRRDRATSGHLLILYFRILSPYLAWLCYPRFLSCPRDANVYADLFYQSSCYMLHAVCPSPIFNFKPRAIPGHILSQNQILVYSSSWRAADLCSPIYHIMLHALCLTIARYYENEESYKNSL